MNKKIVENSKNENFKQTRRMRDEVMEELSTLWRLVSGQYELRIFSPWLDSQTEEQLKSQSKVHVSKRFSRYDYFHHKLFPPKKQKSPYSIFVYPIYLIFFLGSYAVAALWKGLVATQLILGHSVRSVAALVLLILIPTVELLLAIGSFVRDFVVKKYKSSFFSRQTMELELNKNSVLNKETNKVQPINLNQSIKNENIVWKSRHLHLIELSNKLGYKITGGLCHGATHSWLKACLLNAEDQFNKRINDVIKFNNSNSFLQSLESAKTKKKNNESLTQEDLELLHIPAFLEEIYLYQLPKQNSDLFDGQKQKVNQFNVMKKSNSINLENEVKELSSDLGIYNQNDLKNYLEDLALKIQEKDSPAAVGLFIGAFCRHGMGLYYDKSGSWKFMDINDEHSVSGTKEEYNFESILNRIIKYTLSDEEMILNFRSLTKTMDFKSEKNFIEKLDSMRSPELSEKKLITAIKKNDDKSNDDKKNLENLIKTALRIGDNKFLIKLHELNNQVIEDIFKSKKIPFGK